MAKDMYISPLFKGAYSYAKNIGADKIFILSAKYGLLEETDIIEPYDETLNDKKMDEIKAWSSNVLKSLSERTDLKNDEFILLAGERYRRYLIPELCKVSIPLEGLGIGKQLAFYKEHNNKLKACDTLHKIISNGKIFNFNSSYETIPKNGIYIMFEGGEKGHNTNRVVRIGTHTGENQLRSRIFQHYENKNKNRSIFRKNIGRCFLNRENNPYLPIWEIDTTSRANKEKYSHLIDSGFEADLEDRISRYIQENIEFCVLDIPNKEDRLYYEARLIGTISSCEECFPSESWLGKNSTKEKIKNSGLWQEMHLYSQPLNEKELLFIDSALVRE